MAEYNRAAHLTNSRLCVKARPIVKHVSAKPELKWEGFEPHLYSLDTQKVWTLPLSMVPTGEITTVGKITATFGGQKVEIEDRTLDLVIKSESQELILKGPDLHRKMLKLLFWLADRSLSPFDVQWFYYDSDTCRKDPQEMYKFFLVAGDQIIDESYRVSRWPGSGFDPSLLMTSQDDDPVWSDERDWREAFERFWYRKFYRETRTGQLMVLRPDEPPLYYYPEGRTNAAAGIEAWFAEAQRLLVGIRFALWLLVVLAVIEMIRRWK
jgi:hypothetical protein